jgi:hypothetical protein
MLGKSSQKGVEVKVDMFKIEGTGERTSGVDTVGGFGSVEEVVLVVRGKLKMANPGGLKGDKPFTDWTEEMRRYLIWKEAELSGFTLLIMLIENT